MKNVLSKTRYGTQGMFAGGCSVRTLRSLSILSVVGLASVMGACAESAAGPTSTAFEQAAKIEDVSVDSQKTELDPVPPIQSYGNLHTLPTLGGSLKIKWPAANTLNSDTYWDNYTIRNQDNPLSTYNISEERNCKWLRLFDDNSGDVLQIRSNTCFEGKRRGKFQALHEDIQADLNYMTRNCSLLKACNITASLREKNTNWKYLIHSIESFNLRPRRRDLMEHLLVFLSRPKASDERFVLYNYVRSSQKYGPEWCGYDSSLVSFCIFNANKTLETPDDSHLFSKFLELSSLN